MLYGTVGKACGSALESFLRLYTELPTKDEVLADPIHCRLPDKTNVGAQYAMAMMCSAAMDKSTFNAMWAYTDRIGAQFCVLAVRLAAARNPTIPHAKGYKDFATKHSAVFSRK